MKNKKLGAWGKFQNKPYDIKFIWYSLFFTLIAICLAAIANYLWFKFNGGNEVLKLDGQTLVGVFALAIGLPIAIVGAWAAIRIATLAQDTQDRQHALETKLFLIELTNPIKNNFIELAKSLDELLTSARLVELISIKILNPIINEKSREFHEGADPLFDEVNIKITKEDKQNLNSAQELLFKKYDNLISSLFAIQSDSKSSAYWSWKLSNDKIFVLNNAKTRIKDNLGRVNQKDFTLYLKTYEGLSFLTSCCKFLKKQETTNYLQLSNQEILNLLKLTHSKALDIASPPKYEYEDRAIEKVIDSINECNNSISKVITYNYDGFDLNVRMLSDLLLIVIMILPTESDIDSFLYKGPFEDVIGTKSVLNSILYSFDASSFLSADLKEMKDKLTANSSYYLEAFHRLNIFPSEQDELAEKQAYNKHLKDIQDEINIRYAVKK